MTKKDKEASREVLHRYYRAQIRKIDPENFTVDALVSDGTVDRHGTIIQPEAWKKDLKYYKDHPVLLASHAHGDLLAQIGEAKAVKVTDEGLETRFVYYAGEGNPQADWAWNLVMHGMAMYSVGFIAHEQERQEYKEDKKQDPMKDPHTIYTRVELAEVSQVTVGSNRNALQRAIQDACVDTVAGEKADPDVTMLAELAADITESMRKGEIGEISELASPAPGDGEGAGVDVPPEPAPAPPGEEYKGFEMDEDEERPYPSEHSCRLREPGDFKKGSFVRMDREHKGKKYSVILGKLKDEDTLTEQAYRYDKDTWSPQQAEKHCKDHDGSFEAASGKGITVEIDAAEMREV
jgi:HK97 family phage prohead protease